MKQISVQQAAARQNAGTLLLDVREAEEFAAVAALGAVLLPLSQIQREGMAAFAAAGIDPHAELLLICRSGVRSGMLCEALGEHAINVEGGMLAWQAAGLPLA
jgi:sulfur-carrier protein adenylyltransferase/sulfurtransferase